MSQLYQKQVPVLMMTYWIVLMPTTIPAQKNTMRLSFLMYLSDECWQDVRPELVPNTNEMTQTNLPFILILENYCQNRNGQTFFVNGFWSIRIIVTYGVSNTIVSAMIIMLGVRLNAKNATEKVTAITRRNGTTVKIVCVFQKVDKNLIHSKKNKLTSYRKNCLARKLENQ